MIVIEIGANLYHAIVLLGLVALLIVVAVYTLRGGFDEKRKNKR